MKQFGLIIKLVVSIVFIMLWGDIVPESIQRGFFTASLFIKESLVFFMPLIVFAFIFSCLSAFQSRAPLLIVMVLSFVTLSNFVFSQLGYAVGDFFLPHLGFQAIAEAKEIAEAASNQLEPYFRIPFPHLVRLDVALLIGTLFGLYGAFFGNETLARWGTVLKNKVQDALTYIFIPLVPLYVIGFLFKVHHEESLVEMFSGYGPMIGIVVVAQMCAILVLYYAANLGNMRDVKTSLKNVAPSGLVALSTMSSVATMPLTLEAAEKNTKNMSLAQMMIPSTANIHHVGDSIGVPVLMATVLAISGFEPMTYGTFLVFSMYYMVAKYGVASVPGGEVIVLLPILESHFGFTGAMSGLLTTLYILIDPFITVTNVLSNGAFAIIMDKICGRIKSFQAVEA